MFFAILACHLCSCSGDDYLNAIPKKVSALVELNTEAFANSMGEDADELASSLLGWKDMDKSGLDIERQVYFFETTDGTFGLCMKMDDDDDFSEYVNSVLNGSMHKATAPVEWRKAHFSMYDEKWLMGWNDDALLVMGPIVAAQQQTMQQTMSNLLKLKKEQSARQSILFEELSSYDDDALGRVAMQAYVLPENVAALFTVGLPKKSDPRGVILTFDMQPLENTLVLNGNITSRNSGIKQGLEEAHKVMRAVDMKHIDCFDKAATAHLFFNIEGTTYLPFLRNNPALQSLMTIANAAIDLDNIIRSIEGTCHMQMGSDSTGRSSLLMTAPLKHTKWLSDVNYWMQSTPSGATLKETTAEVDRQHSERHFILTTTKSDENGDSQQTLYFGLYGDRRFYIGTHRPQQQELATKVNSCLTTEEIASIGKARLAMLVNMSAMVSASGADIAASIGKWTAPISKKYKHILYIYE